ncbi:c-type cytochrome [Microbulbifer sp.]|uniref:c-type cytochrome n=1 Tax=Microbulbifer sp. TaxID=1908541 RepID=UPI003F32EEEF
MSCRSLLAGELPVIFIAALLLCGSAIAQTPVENGRYLAAAGDCIACHTATGGRPFVGGRPLPTPFGTIYSANITPDRKTGIGNYTLEDFDAAMRRGKGPHGNLYPAMPYTSYYLIDGEDIDALYRYFMQLPPVEYSPPKNRLIFPANLRFGLSAWNWLYFDEGKKLPQPGDKSARWQRGNYLVNALGHCGECHTPRNFAQAMEMEHRFAGNVLEGWDAVDIRPQALQRQGWTREQLMELFTTASSERGTLFGEMFRVVKHSLRHLSEEDLNAIITYLLDDGESRPADFHNMEQAAARYPAGRGDFIAYCAGCHGREGRGILLAFAPPMDGNAAIRARNPHNSIAVILRGLPEQRLSRTRARAGMPGFHRELDDARLAELVNFMRSAWGGAEAEVSAEEVAKIRGELSDHGYLGARE